MTRYDPWDPDIMADPYPVYAWLRNECPVYHNEELGFFALSRFEDVAGGLRDHERLSSADGTALDPGNFGPRGEPPEHTYQRRVISPAFTPRALKRRSKLVTDIADRLLDQALERREVDVVADIANPMAMSSLAHALGLPDDNHEDWLELTHETFANISAKNPPTPRSGFSELQLSVGRRVDEIVEARKRGSDPASADDLIASVIGAAKPNDAGWRLDRLGRAATVSELVPPGLETTRHLIGNAFELIARFPDQWDLVTSGSVDVAAFVEEALRYESPVQGFFRGTREPVRVGTEGIPAGARVLMLYGSANRDEQAFEHAHEFRPVRARKEHLAFGAGIHYCVGAGLARLEAAILFEGLARRVRAVRLHGDGKRTPHALNRGWEFLPVTLYPLDDGF